MANYADDPYRIGSLSLGGIGAEIARYPYGFSHSIIFAKGLLGENFVNHGDKLITHAVLVIEEAPFQERNSHYLQVVGRYAGCQRKRHLVRRRHR